MLENYNGNENNASSLNIARVITSQRILQQKSKIRPTIPFYIQVTLEQHRPELCRSTYKWWFYFQLICTVQTSTVHCQLVVGNVCAEDQLKLHMHFFTVWVVDIPNLHIVQGSTIYNVIRTTTKKVIQRNTFKCIIHKSI